MIYNETEKPKANQPSSFHPHYHTQTNQQKHDRINSIASDSGGDDF